MDTLASRQENTNVDHPYNWQNGKIGKMAEWTYSNSTQFDPDHQPQTLNTFTGQSYPNRSR